MLLFVLQNLQIFRTEPLKLCSPGLRLWSDFFPRWSGLETRLELEHFEQTPLPWGLYCCEKLVCCLFVCLFDSKRRPFDFKGRGSRGNRSTELKAHLLHQRSAWAAPTSDIMFLPALQSGCNYYNPDNNIGAALFYPPGHKKINCQSQLFVLNHLTCCVCVFFFSPPPLRPPPGEEIAAQH